MSSLVVLWLGLGAFTTVALGWGTKIQSKKLNINQTLLPRLYGGGTLCFL